MADPVGFEGSNVLMRGYDKVRDMAIYHDPGVQFIGCWRFSPRRTGGDSPYWRRMGVNHTDRGLRAAPVLRVRHCFSDDCRATVKGRTGHPSCCPRRSRQMSKHTKPLVWHTGKPSKVNGKVNYDYADTPFGQYKVWYSDGALWVPNLAEHSHHGTVNLAKLAAQDHLELCVAELLA